MLNPDNQGGGNAAPLIGNIAGAIGQYASTKEQSKTARRNTDATNRANREMAEYAYSMDLEQWRRQNEYNTPKAQMERFADAGLNPNLMYGQGNEGNASSYAKYNAPRMDYNYKPDVDPMAMLSQFLNIQQQSAQIDNIQANTEKTKEETIIADWTKDIRQFQSLEAGRQNQKQALIHGQYMNNANYVDEYKAMIANFTEDQKRVAGMQLKNEYQSELNRLIKQGLSPGDDYKLRIGISILNALGVNTTDLVRKTEQATAKQPKYIKTIPKEWEKFQ